MDKKLVIIPTYNERENIQDIVKAVFKLEGQFHVLVIDDGSPDGTAALVKGMQETFPDTLHLLERSGKLGLGTAYLTGFAWALEHGYDYVFEMDADFSHNPADLLRLYKACKEEGADLSIGSRYCNGVSVVDWPISRILIETGIQTQGGAHCIYQPPKRHLKNERRYLWRGFLGRDGAPVPLYPRPEISLRPIRLRSRSTERTWTFTCWWSLSTCDGTAIPRTLICEA